MTVMFHRSVSLEVVVGTVVDFARGRGRDGNAPDPSVPVVVWETAPSSGPYRCCLVGIKHFGTWVLFWKDHLSGDIVDKIASLCLGVLQVCRVVTYSPSIHNHTDCHLQLERDVN